MASTASPMLEFFPRGSICSSTTKPGPGLALDDQYLRAFNAIE